MTCWIRRILLGLAAIAGLILGAVSKGQSAERFDMKVRNDFFAGFAGDSEALTRGLKAAEATLAENPKHAEALVWHGSGVMMQANVEFRKQNFENGMKLFQQAVEEMDRAVALEPESVAVRIPRGATLLIATRFMPAGPDSDRLLKNALADYEKALSLQTDRLDSLSKHAKGELLFGLAEGWSRAGDKDRASSLFQRISKEMPGTAYADRAAQWSRAGSLSPEQTRCVGCHVSGK